MNVEKNKSYVFLTPMLEFDPVYSRRDLIINSYMHDEKYPDRKGVIYVHYIYDKNPGAMSRLEAWLIKHSEFIDCYEPDKYSMIFCFNVPKKYQLDYVKFINSKYSELSPNYKLKILKFFNASVSNDIYKVLYKDPEYKKQLERELEVTLPQNAELGSAINYENETYSETKLIKDDNSFVELMLFGK
jgi:hypothetical protein